MTEPLNPKVEVPTLSHLNQKGEANMVDVTEKAMTSRTATAQGYIKMTAETLGLITTGKHKKRVMFLLLPVLPVFKRRKSAVI